MAISEEMKKSGKIKPIIIILIAFLMVPILTVAIVYYANQDFRFKADKVLSSLLPGNIGSGFAKKPSKEEEQQLKVYIAKQYITYEEERLADKLQIIKAEDQQLYNDLIILLNRENSTKMSRVREILRRAELKDDSFQRILAELELDKENAADVLLKHYTSLKTSDAIKEIERTFASGELTLEMLPLVFSKLSVEQSATLIQYLDEDLQQKITFRLKPSRKMEVEKKIQGNKQRNLQLIEMAEVYKESLPEELVEELGTNNKFNKRDLALIYQNLPVDKAGRILANVKDQEFIVDLYEAINELEKLNDDTVGLSSNLAASTLVFQEYHTKLEELAIVYQRMPIKELTNIVEQMLRGNQVYQKHQLENGVEVTFTQEQLVVDVLRKLKPSLVANLLKELDTSRSVELSKKLMIN